MGLLEKVAAAEFIGMEFATWLYWLSETNSGKIRLDQFEEFELWFESPITMVSEYGEATSIVLKGGTPLEGPEARQAFRENKKISRTKVRVNFRNQTYTFNFNALDFSISGLRVPAPPNSSGPDYIILRLEILEEFDAFFHSLFRYFLHYRLDDKLWAKERGRLASWIKEFEFV